MDNEGNCQIYETSNLLSFINTPCNINDNNANANNNGKLPFSQNLANDAQLQIINLWWCSAQSAASWL